MNNLTLDNNDPPFDGERLDSLEARSTVPKVVNRCFRNRAFW